MTEPVTRLVAGGARRSDRGAADCRAGKAERITVRNVPSFVDKLDATLEVEGIGTLTVDTAYGGDSFVLVAAGALGLRIAPDEARDIAELGVRITRAANEQLGFRHPENPGWAHISFCQVTGAGGHESTACSTGANAVAIEPGKIDRSPCGTGCSARIAVLHARGICGRRPVHRNARSSARASSAASRPRPRWPGGARSCRRSPAAPGSPGRISTCSIRTIPGRDGYRLSDTWPGASEEKR